MKSPKPERQNIRVIRFVQRLFALPLVMAAALYTWARRRRENAKTPEVRRAADALRQSRARRKLRGLPPDHVQRSSATADKKPSRSKLRDRTPS